MKKVLKKSLSLMLALVMVLSFVQTASANDGEYFETAKFAVGFDSLTHDSVIGSKPNQYVNGGREDNMYQGFYMKNEVSGNEEGFYLGDGATYNAGASSKIIAREDGNNALEVTVSQEKAVSPYIDYAYGIGFAPAADSTAKITLDVMRYDMSVGLSLRTKDTSGNWIYDLLTFSTDGKIKFLGKEVMDYTVENWYNSEIRYNLTANVWQLYVNGQLKKSVTQKFNMAAFERMRVTWTSTDSAETKIAFDNFSVSEMIENETKSVNVGFDSLTADSVIGSKPGEIVNGGKETSLWDGFYIVNEVTDEAKGIYVNDGEKYNGGASSKIIARKDGDNAMMVTVAAEKNVTPQINIGLDLNIAPQKENSVMHMGFDIYRYDMSCPWSLWLNANPKGWNYDLFELTDDGKIKFFGSNVMNYQAETWYDIDIYYSNVSGKFYLYVDNTLVKTHLRGLNLESLVTFRATWTSPLDSETKIAIDNICLGELTSVEKKGELTVKQDGEVIEDGTFTAGTLSAECEIIEADTLLPNVFIAQYDGNELVGVSVGTYYDGKVMASYEVAEAKGTVKVMLLDTYFNVKPIAKDIELSAK